MILKQYFSGAVLGVAGLAVLIALTLTPAQDDKQVALIFPPWIGEHEAMRQTAELGLPIIRWGASHHTVILDVSREDDARSRLNGTGWLVIAAEIAAGCFLPRSERQNELGDA